MQVKVVFIIIILFFFFNDTATTEIYTLSLHDALPISRCYRCRELDQRPSSPVRQARLRICGDVRSEEHTSELQSRPHLVCRLLLEKKKNEDDANIEKIHTTSQPTEAGTFSYLILIYDV